MHTCLSFIRKVNLFVTGFLWTLVIVFISTSTYSLSLRNHILTFLLEIQTIIELRLIFSIYSTHSIYTSATYGIRFLILYKSTQVLHLLLIYTRCQNILLLIHLLLFLLLFSHILLSIWHLMITWHLVRINSSLAIFSLGNLLILTYRFLLFPSLYFFFRCFWRQT